MGAEGGQLEELVAQELQHNNSKGLSNYQHHNIILIALTYSAYVSDILALQPATADCQVGQMTDTEKSVICTDIGAT